MIIPYDSSYFSPSIIGAYIPEGVLDIAATAGDRRRGGQTLRRAGGGAGHATGADARDAVALHLAGVRLMPGLTASGSGGGCGAGCRVQTTELDGLEVDHEVGEFLGDLATLLL